MNSLLYAQIVTLLRPRRRYGPTICPRALHRFIRQRAILVRLR